MHMGIGEFFGRNASRASAMTSPTTSATDQSKVRFPSEAARQDNRDVLLQELLDLFCL